MKAPIVAGLKQKQQPPPMSPMSPTSSMLLMLLLMLLSLLAQPIRALSTTTGSRREATQRPVSVIVFDNNNLPDVSSHSLPTRLAAANSSSTATTTTGTTITPSGARTAINHCREACLAQCWSRCLDTLVEEEEEEQEDEKQAVRFAPYCQLQLTIQRLVRNESLVLAEISWHRSVAGAGAAAAGTCGAPLGDQCLVTWEVSGGGLMGNLLTEATSNAQLSLWTDTNYLVQVTCRDKHTSSLVRSASLQLNTSVVMAATRGPFAEHANNHPWLTEGDDDESMGSDGDGHPTVPSPTPPSLFISPASSSDSRELILLAVFVALLLFLLILLASVLVVRWRPGHGLGPGYTGDRDQTTDRHVLLENELLVDILHV
ncbi:transmembrane protein fend-like isoform X2 [Anopheles aquasalis]|uniref:transmembrane protein fend-like isoform X2 n=1 Tax=Anopheles aquasalis TaxID=42839 RepID=UPI00215A97B5|nr:transmembrane protein fend-like isoform X2 [Anopheles aquasalis]